MELWFIYYLMNICLFVKLISGILCLAFGIGLIIDWYSNERFSKQLVMAVAVTAAIMTITPTPDTVKYAFIDDLYEVVEEE